jgi:hypothetical protein
MNHSRIVEATVDFRLSRYGRKQLCTVLGHVDRPEGRLPRITRLMALATRFEGLLRAGLITDQAQLARLGHVTRARITQVMNLLHLAPDIQEEILFLPAIRNGREPVRLAQVQAITRQWDWRRQREMWLALRRRTARFPETSCNCLEVATQPR